MDFPNNYLCVSCTNPLIENGLLLNTLYGLFLCCDICRSLYFIDTINTETGNTLVITFAKLDPELEFDLIRWSEVHGTLRDYIQSIPQQPNINPHFKKNLNSLIDESSTPSDLIRRLQGD